jgi:hypothetical protein
MGMTSDLVTAMADGIGEFSYLSEEWIGAAQKQLTRLSELQSDSLAGKQFVYCEVAHNAPAFLHVGPKLAMNMTIDNGSVSVAAGELPDSECDFKLQGDHSILSNLAHVQYHGHDPKVVAAAIGRLGTLSRWETAGEKPIDPAIKAFFRSAHDAMAPLTMPRFVFMTPEWATTGRYVVSTRAEKYRDQLSNIEYTFSEVFTDTPGYAFPDGSYGGFWVRCDRGNVTVGAGPLPEALQPADLQGRGLYTPVVPAGRTVNAALTEEEQQQLEEYSKVALGPDKDTGRRPMNFTLSEKGPFGPELGGVMEVLHDEMSKRTAGDLPSDYDDSIKSEWATPNQFDRPDGYDKSWLRYDEVDIFGDPR